MIKAFPKFNTYSRVLIVIAIGTIGLKVVYNNLMAPHVSYLKTVNLYQDSMGATIENNKKVIEAAAEKKVEFEKKHEEFKTVEDGFFHPVAIREFFDNLDAMAVDTNCILDSFIFSSDTPKLSSEITIPEDVKICQATIELKGGYNDIVRFLSKLTDRKEKISIDYIEIDSQRTYPHLKCVVIFTTYLIEHKGSFVHE